MVGPSRLLKNDFGVRRLVAAFALAQKQVLKLVATLTCGQSGNELPHSKISDSSNLNLGFAGDWVQNRAGA